MSQVLLIDDDKTILTLYSTFLAKEGIRSKTANNAEDAIRVVLNEPVRLIITDINMPGMTGIELARLLKNRYTSIPIIAMSALPFSTQKEALIEAGIIGFLRKPVKRELFIQTVQKYL